MKKCPKCNQINTTLMWWESSEYIGKNWVCYPCGMRRREEQNRIEKKWLKDNTHGTTPST